MTKGFKSRTKRTLRPLLLRRDGPNCQICELPFTETNEATIDHRLERSRGGKNDLDNLMLTHQTCNHHRTNNPHRIKIILREALNRTKMRRLDYWEDDGGFVPGGHLGPPRNYNLKNHANS